MSAVAPNGEVIRVAERALLVRYHDAGLNDAVARAHALRARLAAEVAAESGELVCGAGSLLLRLPERSDGADVERWRARLELEAAGSGRVAAPALPRAHRIETRFGGAAGPDLDEVARLTGLAAGEVVARLCAATLTVAFVGFSPGFPYLIGLPPELEVPRLASPRPRVPAGSVAVAGPFAGIYPSATPGGWRLLGRTDAVLFDPAASPPARLGPGDRVRLVAR